MNFKELLDKDLESTFYNTEEFAEVKKVKYDGKTKDIPVVFDYERTKERVTTFRDKVDDIYILDVSIRFKLQDLKITPRRGTKIFIDDDLFNIANVESEYNEVILDLERIDE